MSDETEVTRGGNGFAWFLVGIVIGAGAAILCTPKTGKDARKILSKKTEKGRDAVTDTGHDLIVRSRDLYEKGRELVDEASQLFERGRKLVRG